MFGSRSLLSVAFLVAVLALTSCSALKQALGLDAKNDAPVFVGLGVAAFIQSPDGTLVPANPLLHVEMHTDASGDLGGDSSAGGQGGTATQTTSVDPKAVADGIATLAATAAPGSPAATLLGQAKTALDGGNAKEAAALLEKAKTASPAAPGN